MTGKELRFKRELIGLSATDLGKLCGVTRQTINNMERVGEDQLPDNPTLRVIKFELGKAFVETHKVYFKINKVDL